MPIKFPPFEWDNSDDEDVDDNHPINSLDLLPSDQSKWPWNEQVGFVMRGKDQNVVYLPSETKLEKFNRIQATKKKKEVEKAKRLAKKKIKEGKIKPIDKYFKRK